MIPVSETTSKDFAHKLALAIEAECLTYRHYIPWADGVIAWLDQPPLWICDLSTIKYRPDALRVIREFLGTEPFEQFNTSTEEYLGFLWIRYERGELSWATFLKEAGGYSDCGNSGIDCEYFFSMLNDLEEAEFRSNVEARQCEAVRQRLKDTLVKTCKFYAKIRGKD